MTAPFPTHKQEEWRYADLDALKPVWEQFAAPVTLTVGAGEESAKKSGFRSSTTCSFGACSWRSARSEGAHLRAQHCAGLRPHRA